MSDKIDLTRTITTSFIPEYLASNEDFLVFLKLAISEFNISMENIQNFSDLVNPDKVPMKFIEALGSYTNFKKSINADEEFNREMLMRMQSIYRERGTDHSIIMAATHGSNEGWIGGDLFIPGYDISKDRATIVMAKDNIFTHSRSRHSGGDRFSDSDIYRPGVVIITLPYVDDDIRNAVDANMPVGVKYYFILVENLIPSEGSVGAYGEVSDFGKYHVASITDDEKAGKTQEKSNGTLIFNLKLEDDRSSVAIFDVNTKGQRLRSGRLTMGFSVTNENVMGASYRNLSTLYKPFMTEDEENEILGIEVPEISPEEQERLDLIAKIEAEREENLNKLELRRIIPKFGDTTSPFGTDHSLSGLSSEEIDKIISDNTGEIVLPEIEVPEKGPRIPNPDVYIVSESGEVLDLKSRDTIRHITRDLDDDSIYTDFSWSRKTLPKRSESSSTRGRRTLMSGSLSGVLDNYVNPYEIVPDDLLRPVADVADKKVVEFFSWDYQSSVEIEDVKWSPKPIEPDPGPDPEPVPELTEDELRLANLRVLHTFSTKNAIYGKSHSFSGLSQEVIDNWNGIDPNAPTKNPDKPEIDTVARYSMNSGVFGLMSSLSGKEKV